MNPLDEPLLRLAVEVAEGEEIDWDRRREALSDIEGSAPVLRGLHWLAELQRRFRDPAAGEAALSADPPSGSWRWGHLEVGELLGSGSFGEVFRAYDPVLRREVALKVRPEQGQGRGETAFIAEARRLARVRHPHVLAVHGADVHAGRAGLWADLLRGQTLEEVLRQGRPIPASLTLDLAAQVAEALVAVHDAGIVHGDVKASNVMLEPSGRAVLMDFGAGSDLAAESRPAPAAGSPLSTAPEIFAGQPASFAGDVYGAGVLLFRLLTGRYPVDAQTLAELDRRLRAAQAPDWRPEDRVPRALRRLVERLLAADPGQRPTAAEMLAELKAIEDLPRQRRRRWSVITVLASLLLALAASTAGWLSAQRSAREAEAARLEAEATSTFLTDLLLAPDILKQGPEVRVLDVMDEARTLAESSLAARPTIRGRILWLIGRVKASLGQGEEALGIFEQAEKAFAEASGEAVTEERALVTVRRARLHIERAELEQADALLQEIGPTIEALGPDTTVWIHWLRTRAYLLNQRGEMDQAEELFRRILAARGDSAMDPELQVIRLELAIVLYQRGRLEEAEPLFLQNLEWNLREHGERHENTLIVRYNLAGLQAQSGRLEEAEALFRKNAEVAREWLGEQHRLHLLSLTGLIEVLGDQGRVEEASALDEEVVPLADAAWGEEHPRSQILRVNAANRLIQTEHFAEAEKLLRPALGRLEERLGASASAPLHAQMVLVELLLQTGRAAEAAEVATATLELASSSLGEDNPVTLGTRARLGRAWTALGRVDESLPLLRTTLERHRKVLGDGAGEVVLTQIALAEAEAAAGHGLEARRLLCDATEHLQGTLGPDHAQTRAARQRLETAGGCPTTSPVSGS